MGMRLQQHKEQHPGIGKEHTVTMCCTERRIFVTSLWIVKRTYEFAPSIARHESSNWLLSTLFARWSCSRLKKSACNAAASRDAVLAASASSNPCTTEIQACCYTDVDDISAHERAGQTICWV
jgi:hypothetical protein